MRGADHPGLAGGGVQLDHLVRAAGAGPDADDPAAPRGERGGELGPGSGRVDDLAGVQVEDAERGGAPAVHHGGEPVVEQREPAGADLPQRSAELLLAGAQCRALAAVGVEAVEVPVAGGVAGVDEGAVGGPFDLGDGLLRAARDGPGLAQQAVPGHLGDQQRGAVPGHPRMVPAQPGGAAAVRGEPGAGDEPVAVVGEFAYGVPVLGRRAVQRHRGDDPADVGGALPGELLQDAPHLVPLRVRPRVHPAQSAAHRRHRGERAGLAAGFVAVEALVGEVHEDHEGAGVPHQAGPGLAAVLHDPTAHVPRGRQHRLLRAVGRAPHQGAPAALGGPGLGPPRLVADEADGLGMPVVRGGERRVDRRGP